LPNLGRILIKKVYRYPLMITLPPFFEEKLGTSNLQMTKACSGFGIAIIESFILCPFERIKVYLMTLNSQQKKGSFSWVSEFR